MGRTFRIIAGQKTDYHIYVLKDLCYYSRIKQQERSGPFFHGPASEAEPLKSSIHTGNRIPAEASASRLSEYRSDKTGDIL